LGMRLRRLMGVADQIVASRFSSIDLSNKAIKTPLIERCFYKKLSYRIIYFFQTILYLEGSEPPIQQAHTAMTIIITHRPL
ncbi:hypothetical protein EAY31_19465, partial [Vibrio anguillarum]|nr:hypothetical protein [Vibrio anguillarum]